MTTLNMVQDRMLGALLIGTYVNSFLYILAFVETVKYFRYFKQDGLFVRVCVLLALAADTLATAATDGMVYLNLVTHWGDETFLSNRLLIVPVFVILTTVSGTVSRAHLGVRYLRLTKNRFPFLLIVLSTIASIVGTVLLAHALIAQRITESLFVFSDHHFQTLFWLAVSLAADVLVALASLVSRHFSRNMGFPRFCSLLLRSGVAGVAFSLAALILFVVDKDHRNLSFAVTISLGRVYSHAMLRNLNARDPNVENRPKSLPHVIEIASYPFMPSSPATLEAALTTPLSSRPKIHIKASDLKNIKTEDLKTMISTPVYMEDPSPKNLIAEAKRLKQERVNQLGRSPTIKTGITAKSSFLDSL